MQNMCQRVSTAARHFYTIYAIFTLFYMIFAQFYMIFTRFYAIFAFFTRLFARQKYSAARHLKLFCTPAFQCDQFIIFTLGPGGRVELVKIMTLDFGTISGPFQEHFGCLVNHPFERENPEYGNMCWRIFSPLQMN